MNIARKNLQIMIFKNITHKTKDRVTESFIDLYEKYVFVYIYIKNIIDIHVYVIVRQMSTIIKLNKIDFFHYKRIHLKTK